MRPVNKETPLNNNNNIINNNNNNNNTDVSVFICWHHRQSYPPNASASHPISFLYPPVEACGRRYLINLPIDIRTLKLCVTQFYSLSLSLRDFSHLSLTLCVRPARPSCSPPFPLVISTKLIKMTLLASLFFFAQWWERKRQRKITENHWLTPNRERKKSIKHD